MNVQLISGSFGGLGREPYPTTVVLNPYCVLSVVNAEGTCYCGGDARRGRMPEAGAKLERDGSIGRGGEEFSRYFFAW